MQLGTARYNLTLYVKVHGSFPVNERNGTTSEIYLYLFFAKLTLFESYSQALVCMLYLAVFVTCVNFLSVNGTHGQLDSTSHPSPPPNG